MFNPTNDWKRWSRPGLAGAVVVVSAGAALWISEPARRVESGDRFLSREGVAARPPSVGVETRNGAEAAWARGDAGAGDEGVAEAEEARRPASLPVFRGLRGADLTAGAATAVSDAEVWAQYEPTREELEYRARVIEARAEKELANLLRVVPLDDERQDRVFAALVRSSEWYHPALQVAGSSGSPLRPAISAASDLDASSHVGGSGPEGRVVEAVTAELTPEEATVYERYASERTAFWVGVVEDAEKQLQAAP